MAHEITSTDRVLLHKTQAWHGLGIVIEHAATPTEALELAGLDWRVEQWPMSATDGEVRQTIESHVLNVRDDTKEQLGVVGEGYEVIQNRDVAEFCEALADEGQEVQVESAGSIRGGRKLWFLLKGETFSVNGSDTVEPYICVSNGHDGTAAMRVTPTTVRVVCSNTLHMVIPRADTGKTIRQSLAIRHTGDVKDKVEDARRALAMYNNAVGQTRTMMGDLAAREVGAAEVKQFWLRLYERQLGKVPMAPTTASEQRAKDRALDAAEAMAKRFDTERGVAGTTAWNAMNAYTGWLQHDRATNAKDPSKKAYANMLGTAGSRSTEALTQALATFA